MKYEKNKSNFPMKLVYLAIAVVCIMIGMIGLIIPIIPGLLFFLFAVFMFGKVSTRFKRWSDQYPTIRKIQHKLSRLDTVGYMNRVKVVALMSLDVIVSTVAQIVTATRRIVRKFSKGT